jgi:hypothetical protein
LKLQSKKMGVLCNIYVNERNIIKLWRKSPFLTFSMENIFLCNELMKLNSSFFFQILSCVLHNVYEFHSDPLSYSFLPLFFEHHCLCHPVQFI